MKPSVRSLLSLVIASALGVSGTAYATNGMFLPGYGAKSLGMGGVGVAYAQDSLAAASNPAGIVDVGTRADVNFGLLNPERHSFSGNSAGSYVQFPKYFDGEAESKNHLYLLPSMGFTMAWDDKISIGIAMVANGGGNTTYEPNIFASPALPGIEVAQTLGVDLIQLLIPMTVAYKVTDDQAIGLSFVLGAQRFSARGLESFTNFGINSDELNFSGNGNDYVIGGGVRVGWRGKFFNERLTLGATYAGKINMQKFGRYKGLFANHGDLDVPANYAVGLAFKPTEDITLAMDVQRTLYAEVPSIGNRGPSRGSVLPTVEDQGKKLGLDRGMGFGWTNQTVYKYGVDYKYNQNLTIRAGYNFGKSPIPDDQLAFNLLLPAASEHHFTVGFTYEMADGNEITMSALHSPQATQQACRLTTVGCAKIQAKQNALDISYAWKF